jgi:hypothetical protein
MGLNFLLLTRDTTLLKVIQRSFSAATVGLQLRTDAASAIELSARRRLDGFVIDCDDVSGDPDVLAKIRRSDPIWLVLSIELLQFYYSSPPPSRPIETPIPPTVVLSILWIPVSNQA